MKKWQNWSKFENLKFQGSNPIKETHLHQNQLICTFFEIWSQFLAILSHFLAKNGLKWPKSAFSSNWLVLFGIFLPISLIPLRTRKNILIRTFKHLYRGHNRPKTGQKQPKMAKNGQNQHFPQTDCCYSEFFYQSHSFHLELGKIYSLGPLNTYTGAISGQKQAKNSQKWP